MTITRLFSIANLLTLLLVTSFGVVGVSSSLLATERAAVFEFELLRGSVYPGTPDHRDAEDKRLKMIAERLRGHLASSGLFEIVDTAPVANKAASANLQACGNCADDLALGLGADYAFTGYVFKVSELILSINVAAHEAATSRLVAGASVDLRGNTDKSWKRGIDYLYEHVLSPRLETLKK